MEISLISIKFAVKLPMTSKWDVLGGSRNVWFPLLMFYDHISGSFIKEFGTTVGEMTYWINMHSFCNHLTFGQILRL